MEDSCPTCVQASLRGLQTDQCFDSIHLNMHQTLKENDKPSPFVNAFPKLSADSWGRFCPHVYLSVLTLCFLDFSVMHLSAPLCNCPSAHYPPPHAGQGLVSYAPFKAPSPQPCSPVTDSMNPGPWVGTGKRS